MTIHARTLGPLQLAVNGAEPVPELLWRKHAALLIYLARSPSRGRTREHLVGLLWPDKPEPAARHSLSEAIRIIRRAEPDGIMVSGGQVRLSPGTVELDTDVVERLAADGRAAEAAALVTGEFIEGFAAIDAPAFEEWLAAERLYWRQRGVALLAAEAQSRLDRGRLIEAAELARRAEELDPQSDVAARAAMRAAALAGHRIAAARIFERLRGRLAEVGAVPDGETAALAARIARERSAPALPDEGPAGGRRFPLVGRDDELRRLAAARRDATARRRAAVLLIEGDAGAGRTRLADELASRARLEGAATALLRGVEADGLAPWNGVLALARGDLATLPGLARAQPGALAALAAHIPEWGDRFAAARRTPPMPLERALLDVVLAAAAEQPILLVVDDAARLDRESLAALLALARDAGAAPVALCLTVATHEHRPELDELVVRLDRDLPGAAVRLAPLTVGEIAELAAALLPSTEPAQRERLARRVASDSAGLPLLVVELIHAVANGLTLDPTVANWPAPLRTLEQTRPVELPPAVVAAIRLNARRLSAAAQQMLMVIAVAEPPVPLPAAALGADFDEAAAAAALDELEWHRWLTSDSRGFAFLARVVRDVIVHDLLTPGRRRRIAERLAARAGERGGLGAARA